jgi:hypothetical protein
MNAYLSQIKHTKIEQKGVRFIYSDFTGLPQPHDPISIPCLRSIHKINLTPFTDTIYDGFPATLPIKRDATSLAGEYSYGANENKAYCCNTITNQGG